MNDDLAATRLYASHNVSPLEQYLHDLCDQLKRLPLHSPARGPLISRIRDIEQQIDWMKEL